MFVDLSRRIANYTFTDETESFLGIIIRDRVDDDWGYIVLAREKHFVFRAIETEVSLTTRQEARKKMQVAILRLLSSPTRIFDQQIGQILK